MQKNNQKSFWFRLGIPLVIIIAWLGLSGVGGPYFARIEEVSSNDMLSFLPSDAESTKVNEELMKFRDSDTIPAIVVFESADELSEEQNKDIREATEAIAETGLAKDAISPAIPSEDGRAAFIVIPLGSEDEFSEAL